MATHQAVGRDGHASLDDLTADRQRMFAAFTSATTGVVIGVALILILMAIFLT